MKTLLMPSKTSLIIEAVGVFSTLVAATIFDLVAGTQFTLPLLVVDFLIFWAWAVAVLFTQEKRIHSLEQQLNRLEAIHGQERNDELGKGVPPDTRFTEQSD